MAQNRKNLSNIKPIANNSAIGTKVDVNTVIANMQTVLVDFVLNYETDHAQHIKDVERLDKNIQVISKKIENIDLSDISYNEEESQNNSSQNIDEIKNSIETIDKSILDISKKSDQFYVEIFEKSLSQKNDEKDKNVVDEKQSVSTLKNEISEISSNVRSFYVRIFDRLSTSSQKNDENKNVDILTELNFNVKKLNSDIRVFSNDINSIYVSLFKDKKIANILENKKNEASKKEPVLDERSERQKFYDRFISIKKLEPNQQKLTIFQAVGVATKKYAAAALHAVSQKVFGFLNKTFDKFEKFGDKLSNMLLMLGPGGYIIKFLIWDLPKTLVKVFTKLLIGLFKIGGAIGKMLFVDLPKKIIQGVHDSLTSPVGLLMWGVMFAMIFRKHLVAIWDKYVAPTFGPIFNKAWNFVVGTIFPKISEMIHTAWGTFKTNFLPKITDALKTAFNEFRESAGIIFETVGKIWNGLVAWYNDPKNENWFSDNIWKPIHMRFDKFVENIKEWYNSPGVQNFIDRLISFIEPIMEKIKDKIIETILLATNTKSGNALQELDKFKKSVFTEGLIGTGVSKESIRQYLAYKLDMERSIGGKIGADFVRQKMQEYENSFSEENKNLLKQTELYAKQQSIDRMKGLQEQSMVMSGSYSQAKRIKLDDVKYSTIDIKDIEKLLVERDEKTEKMLEKHLEEQKKLRRAENDAAFQEAMYGNKPPVHVQIFGQSQTDNKPYISSANMNPLLTGARTVNR